MPGLEILVLWMLTVVDAPRSPADMGLEEGNRLFRQGRLDAALDAYSTAIDTGATNPILAYNLGVTTHSLARLPEAILWYRRAAQSLEGDPWLQENLEQARRQLGTVPFPDPGFFGIRQTAAPTLLIAGLVLAWGAAVWLLARSDTPLWPVALVAVVSLLCFALGSRLPDAAPHPAVLLQDCASEGQVISAGSEIWVSEAPEGAWSPRAPRLAFDCPSQSVALLRCASGSQ